jgi:hypothetical protein
MSPATGMIAMLTLWGGFMVFIAGLAMWDRRW